jgi:hypothetical protein
MQPKEIDKAVHGHGGLNLNKLEAHKQAEILNEFSPDKAIIDCPSNNISSYKIYLKKLLKNKKIELILEHNAERYPLVAAGHSPASGTIGMSGGASVGVPLSAERRPFSFGFSAFANLFSFPKNSFQKLRRVRFR